MVKKRPKCLPERSCGGHRSDKRSKDITKSKGNHLLASIYRFTTSQNTIVLQKPRPSPGQYLQVYHQLEYNYITETQTISWQVSTGLPPARIQLYYRNLDHLLASICRFITSQNIIILQKPRPSPGYKHLQVYHQLEYNYITETQTISWLESTGLPPAIIQLYYRNLDHLLASIYRFTTSQNTIILQKPRSSPGQYLQFYHQLECNYITETQTISWLESTGLPPARIQLYYRNLKNLLNGK